MSDPKSPGQSEVVNQGKAEDAESNSAGEKSRWYWPSHELRSKVWYSVRTRRKILLRLLIAVIVLALVYVLGQQFGSEVPRLTQWVRDLGPWGPIGFIVAAVLLTTILIPPTFLGMVAGAVFGLWLGTLLCFISGVCGATLTFMSARLLIRKPVERWANRYPKIRAIESAVREKGVSLLILLRLSPVSSAPMNYLLGVTRIRYRDYILASVGMIPGQFATVYFGFVARKLSAAGQEEAAWYQYLWTLAGLVLIIALTTYVARLAHKAIREAQHEEVDVEDDLDEPMI